jgi:hypothetical protein
MTRAEAIANDPRVTVAARFAQFATPVIVLAGLTIGGWVLQAQADARTKLENRISGVEAFDGLINSRVSVLESNKVNRDQQIAGINQRIDSNQTALEGKVDTLVDKVGDLASQVAALNATIKALEAKP